MLQNQRMEKENKSKQFRLNNVKIKTKYLLNGGWFWRKILCNYPQQNIFWTKIRKKT